MQVDIDDIVSQSLGWDLTLKLNGKIVATQSPSVGCLALIQALQEKKIPSGETLDVLRKCMEGVLAPDCGVNAASLSVPKMTGAITAVFQYFGESSSKNSGGIAAATKAAMQKNRSTPGRSTHSS